MENTEKNTGQNEAGATPEVVAVARDYAWRSARAVDSELAYEDAMAEAEAWNNT